MSKRSSRVASKADVAVTLRKAIIDNPERHRAALLLTIERVLDGTLDANRANAIANLSGEIHKSVRHQLDDISTFIEPIGIERGGKLCLIKHDNAVDAEEVDDAS